MLTVPFILPRSRDIFQKFEGKSVENTVEPLGSDTSLIRTPLYYGQFPISRQNSHIFYLKKPLQYGLSLIRTTNTKSRPLRVNLYKRNLFITDTAVNR